MKNSKIRRRLMVLALSTAITASYMPATMTAFAADEETLTATEVVTNDNDTAPVAPKKPEATSHKDNDKIKDYNDKVADYNKKASEYNESVDREYEAAVSETNKKNDEIDQHNASEIQRVKDAEERNAQAQKEADEANLKIDEENAAEEALVNEHNRSEDEKRIASEEARAAAEAANEEASAHNEKVAQYKEDKAKYEKDLAQYEVDRYYEGQILNLGYESVEKYNELINQRYNEPARVSEKKNAEARTVSVSDTYVVTEAAEKSGRMIKVTIEHNFDGTDVSYKEEFEIDANDIIKVMPISSIGEMTSYGYGFHYNLDSAHKMGFWYEGWSSVGTNANYNISGWDNGDTHEISFKDGKKRVWDIEDIVIEYNYMWNPLKIYKTYNTPTAPGALGEDPGDLKDLVEVPEIYAPVYRTYNAKEHVTAELEDIIAADIWENLASPVKRAYLGFLDYMALFNEPADAVTQEKKVAAATVKADDKAVPPAAVSNAAAAEIEDTQVPMTVSVDEEHTMIKDAAVPLAAGNWAILNLMAAIAAAVGAVIAIFRRKEDDEEQDDEADNRSRKMFAAKAAGLLTAIAAVITFFLTEDMSLPMVLADKYTLLMAAMLGVQAVSAALNKKAAEAEDEDDAEAETALN